MPCAGEVGWEVGSAVPGQEVQGVGGISGYLTLMYVCRRTLQKYFIVFLEENP